jgi:hypothetical protein
VGNYISAFQGDILLQSSRVRKSKNLSASFIICSEQNCNEAFYCIDVEVLHAFLKDLIYENGCVISLLILSAVVYSQSPPRIVVCVLELIFKCEGTTGMVILYTSKCVPCY